VPGFHAWQAVVVPVWPCVGAIGEAGATGRTNRTNKTDRKGLLIGSEFPMAAGHIYSGMLAEDEEAPGAVPGAYGVG